MYTVKEASSAAELEAVIALRYKILRQPWDQPYETSTDGLEATSLNAFIPGENGQALACGRLQENEDAVGQVRYMAVDTDQQGKGLGRLVLQFLEQQAKARGLKKIELHARENALNFYENAGYRHKEVSYKLWGIIQHYLMEKDL